MFWNNIESRPVIYIPVLKRSVGSKIEFLNSIQFSFDLDPHTNQTGSVVLIKNQSKC